MKVFIIQTGDAILSSNSLAIAGVCSSAQAAIRSIIPYVQEACNKEFEDAGYSTSEAMFQNVVEFLQNNNQTQHFTENFIISEWNVNKFQDIINHMQ